MAGITISSLPAATSPVAVTDVLPVVQGGNTKKVAINQLGYLPAGTGAVTTTIQDKLRETISVFDFMTPAQIADVKANTASLDVSAAVQIAVNASVGKTLFFPAGTYSIGTTINLISNSKLTGESGLSVIKLSSKSWAAANGLMFQSVLDTDVQLSSLVFDGNKGNVGTTRSPIIVVFKSQRISFEDCIFRNAEGICLNVSTDVDDFRVQRCQFLVCGGNPNNSEGYRKQAIAFSTDAVSRSQNIYVEGCYFYQQGLDCISLSDCDNVTIANNTSVDSYTLVYSNQDRVSTNLVIDGNVVRRCSEFGAGTDVPPNAIDLPWVDGAAITGNSLYEIDACGIGVFENAKNLVITGNNIVNPMRAGGSAFVSGIFIGGDTGEIAANNVSVEGNNIVDTAVVPLMKFGITVKSDNTNILLQDNIIRNPLTARYGYTSTSQISIDIFAFTSTTQVSSSTRIVDLDVTNNLETVNGRLYLKTTDNTNPAIQITQLGTSLALEVAGVQRFVPQTQPSSATSGSVYYDSGTNKLRCYNGTIWNDLF